MDLIAPRPGSVVLSYGTFDGLYHADVRLLRHLSGLGRRVIIGCSTDEFLEERGLTAALPFARRRALLESCRYVDHVLPESCDAQKRTDIVNYDVSVFAVAEHLRGRFDQLGDVVQVVYLPRELSAPGTDASRPRQWRRAV